MKIIRLKEQVEEIGVEWDAVRYLGLRNLNTHLINNFQHQSHVISHEVEEKIKLIKNQNHHTNSPTPQDKEELEFILDYSNVRVKMRSMIQFFRMNYGRIEDCKKKFNETYDWIFPCMEKFFSWERRE